MPYPAWLMPEESARKPWKISRKLLFVVRACKSHGFLLDVCLFLTVETNKIKIATKWPLSGGFPGSHLHPRGHARPALPGSPGPARRQRLWPKPRRRGRREPRVGTGGASEGGRGAGQTLGMDGGDLRKKWMVDVEWLNASTGFKMV